MKRFLFFFLFTASVYAQQPSDVGRIDSIVAEINETRFTSTVLINDTNKLLSGMKEREITAYLDGNEIRKVTVKFRNSNRIREVYYGPGKEYENKAVYIKDYDGLTLALAAEIYIWDRKLVKSIVTDPLNDDEIMKPEKIIERSQYTYLVKYSLKTK